MCFVDFPAGHALKQIFRNGIERVRFGQKNVLA